MRPLNNSWPSAKEKKVEAKKLNPNSAAAKRKKASEANKQKEMAILNPSLVNTVGGGKKSSASTKSEMPISDSGDVGNFASFDQVFEDGFDPFVNTDLNDGVVELDTLMDRIHTGDASFMAFDDVNGSQNQRQRSTSPSSQHESDGNNALPYNQAPDSSFEVTFQGLSALNNNDL